MYNRLVCKDICKKINEILCFSYVIIVSFLEILNSDIIIKLINNEKIKYDYGTILSIIICIFHSIAIIVFIVFGIQL